MNTFEKHELVIDGPDKKKISLDITIPKSKTPTPLIVFCHGFKGFKDWGHFNWVAEKCADAGVAFVKFNFSHNGVQADSLTEISDLDAFADNNYSLELSDTAFVLDYVTENAELFNFDLNRLFMAGHSRGGGIAMLRASEDKRVKGLILWASLSEFESFFRPDTIKEWEANGVVYAVNKRTGQKLPLKKQFYDDFIKNKASLDVKKAAKLLAIPLLIIHGDKDESVDISHAKSLYNIVQHSIFISVENGDHTFGAKHPFDPEKDVTGMLEELVENTVEFILE